MYAVVNAAGKQYRVTPGDVIRIEHIQGDVGSNVEFDQVLMIGDDANTRVGAPLVSGAKVQAKILAQGKDKKIIVFKIQRRKRYRRKNGHRQLFTELQVTDIKA